MADWATPRAHIEVVGVGLLEAHPFFRTQIAGPDWPDGTHHAALRPHAWKVWTVERAPHAWVVWSTARAYAPIALAENAVVRVDGVGFKLRPQQASMAMSRVHVRGLDLIDTAWPLTNEAPRRLAVHAGCLVDVHATPADTSAAAKDALVHFVLGAWRWCAVPARFTVPLRFLAEAGVASPVPLRDVDAWDVALDGSLHRAAPAWTQRQFIGSFDVDVDAPLFPGVIEGFFPERVREWRALQEEVAMWPAP